MTYSINAVGEHIILASAPVQAGDQKFSSGGIYLGEEEQSQLPEMCWIHSIGNDVPQHIFNIGDKVVTPLGNIRNVVHPDVALGNAKPSDIRIKYVTCHWKAIAAVYKS